MILGMVATVLVKTDGIDRQQSDVVTGKVVTVLVVTVQVARW